MNVAIEFVNPLPVVVKKGELVLQGEGLKDRMTAFLWLVFIAVLYKEE